MTNLKRIREEKGYTQQLLAQAANVSIGSIKSYEQGRRNINLASTEFVYRLYIVLGCRIEDLIEKENAKEEQA